MGFSGFTILALLGGILGIQIIQAASIPLDIITFTIVLWNFSVVGVLAVFFWKMPIFLKQGYLVFIGAVVAFWFTKLPEWTTWTVLAAMALYDLAAVLAPGGPLKVRVKNHGLRNGGLRFKIWFRSVVMGLGFWYSFLLWFRNELAFLEVSQIWSCELSSM